MAYQSFEELEVWKKACRLAVNTCGLLKNSNAFYMRDQMQRAALSIPSNIAEGSERDSRQDFIRFLRIAKGSAAELRTQSYVAQKLEIITSEQCQKISGESREIAAMLQGLIGRWKAGRLKLKT
jgi:four helix bundle protein